MPWAGNIAQTMTSNRKQFTVTREMLTAVARHLSTWSFVFHRFDPFALLYNKSLNDWSLGEQWILFPSNLNVSLDFVSGNIEILGKQNSLFPSGPVIKCLLFHCPSSFGQAASQVKVSVKENEVPTEKMLVARVFSLQRQVIYQIKAKRSYYLIKDFISSNFKRRLSFLVSNSEVTSLILKLQPFRVVKYSLPFYCIWLTDKRPKNPCEEISDFPCNAFYVSFFA